jgi:hypothetical protein
MPKAATATATAHFIVARRRNDTPPEPPLTAAPTTDERNILLLSPNSKLHRHLLIEQRISQQVRAVPNMLRGVCRSSALFQEKRGADGVAARICTAWRFSIGLDTSARGFRIGPFPLREHSLRGPACGRVGRRDGTPSPNLAIRRPRGFRRLVLQGMAARQELRLL